MEKIKKSSKQIALNVILKILVALSFSWVIWFNALSFYNMLPFMAEGAALLEIIGASGDKTMFLVLSPILSTLLVFGLFILLERMAVNGIDRNLMLFGKQIDREWHKNAIDITALCIGICKGIVATILAYYPLAANITRPIAGLLIKVLFIGLLFFAIAKKDTKEMFPFIYSSLMFPTMLVVFFV